MSETIMVKPGELSARVLKKAIGSLEKANDTLISLSYMRSYGRLADVYYSCKGSSYRLFSNSTVGLIPADVQFELDKLLSYSSVLDTCPERLEKIDKSFKTSIKKWRKSGKHNQILWQTSSGNGTARETEIKNGSQEKVIVNENADYQHQWRGDIIIPPKENKQGNRSGEVYREVMEALDVENNVRYQEGFNPYWGFSSTMCNVYVWDVLTAMDCQLPSTEYFGCGAMRDWMASPAGAEAGWVEVDQATAIAMANKGYPTVAADTVGEHVAMVSPQHDGDIGVYLSQAGASNFNYGAQANGWDSSYDIRYFYHM